MIRLQRTTTGDNIINDPIFIKEYKKVNLSKLGYFGGYRHNKYHNMLVKSLVAFIKMEKNTDEYNLGIRELFPHFDLLDGDGKSFENSEWIQRYPDNIKEKLHYGNYFSVYTSGKNSKNDQKIILLYGIQYLKNNTVTDMMSIWRKNVKIIDLYMLDKHPELGQINLFRTPIIVNLNEQIDITFNIPNIDLVGHHDEIKILGYVAEQIPRNTMG